MYVTMCICFIRIGISWRLTEYGSNDFKSWPNGSVHLVLSYSHLLAFDRVWLKLLLKLYSRETIAMIYIEITSLRFRI